MVLDVIFQVDLPIEELSPFDEGKNKCF